MTSIKQGNTVKITRTLKDELGVVLTDLEAEGKFAYEKAGVVVEVVGDVTDGVFTATLSAADTEALQGTYNYSIKIHDTANDEARTVESGEWEISRDILASFGI